MKNKILIYLGVLFIQQGIALADQTRTITLNTDEPKCQIILTENANASVGGPGDEVITLQKKADNFGDGYAYEYHYAYNLLAPPAYQGGFDISVSSRDNEIQFQVLHTYPTFPSKMVDVPKNIPAGLKALAVVSIPTSSKTISQTIFLDSMIRFEKIFGASYISKIELLCK